MRFGMSLGCVCRHLGCSSPPLGLGFPRWTWRWLDEGPIQLSAVTPSVYLDVPRGCFLRCLKFAVAILFSSLAHFLSRAKVKLPLTSARITPAQVPWRRILVDCVGLSKTQRPSESPREVGDFHLTPRGGNRVPTRPLVLLFWDSSPSWEVFPCDESKPVSLTPPPV